MISISLVEILIFDVEDSELELGEPLCRSCFDEAVLSSFLFLLGRSGLL